MPETPQDILVPSLPEEKVTMALTKASAEEPVELSDLNSKLPLHEDVMQLARLGEVVPVQKLFEDGTVDPMFKDDEGITPLHVSPKVHQGAFAKANNGCI